MRRITMVGAVLVLFAGGVTANAQGIGPGVNPSNPQDLSHRSNPQDMTAPGARNPQDTSASCGRKFRCHVAKASERGNARCERTFHND